MSLQKDVPMVSEWTATLDGFVTHQIQPRLRLSHQAELSEGSYVRKGQVLFEIDARPFVALAEPGEKGNWRRRKRRWVSAPGM